MTPIIIFITYRDGPGDLVENYPYFSLVYLAWNKIKCEFSSLNISEKKENLYQLPPILLAKSIFYKKT